MWVQVAHGLFVRWCGFEEASRGVQDRAWGAGRLPRRAVQGRVASAVEVQGRRGGPRVFRGHLPEVLRVSCGWRLCGDGRRQKILADGMDEKPTVRQVQGRQKEPTPGGAGSDKVAGRVRLQGALRPGEDRR